MNNIFKTIAFIPLYPLYYLRYRFLKQNFPKVQDSIYTLNKILNEKKSLSRFGDGELNLISGKDIGFQNSDNALKIELKRVLSVKNDSCYIALPNVFSSLRHFRLDANCFWLHAILTNWRHWESLFDNRTYLDSLCSRFYMDIKDHSKSVVIFNLWEKLWNGRDIVIIEGDNTKMGVGNDLFDSANSIRRIICPSKNAFERYSQILSEAEKANSDSLILIALGPTASVLAYDLSLCGYQAIDIGHIDLEYNWMLSGKHTKTAIKGRFVNEIKCQSCENFVDDSYESQIIARIN